MKNKRTLSGYLFGLFLIIFAQGSTYSGITPSTEVDTQISLPQNESMISGNHLAAAGVTTRVSVASDGTPGNKASSHPAISADGRFVAFSSEATNLVANDTNGYFDIFVHDTVTRETTRVSVASDGTQGTGLWGCGQPSISADGQYVAFSSTFTNLVSNDTNGVTDVFVHNRQTGETSMVSVTSNGIPGDSFSDYPSISGDGRYIAFQSISINLGGGSTQKIFLHDQLTRETFLITQSYDNSPLNGKSYEPVISTNGRYIAYYSLASNLVVNDTNDNPDTFVYDRQTGITKRVSVASDGTQGSVGNSGTSRRPSISADGRYIAFESAFKDLAPGDGDLAGDVFIHDQSTGETIIITANPEGSAASGFAYYPSISADGRYVAFISDDDLVANDTNARMDVFRYDRQTGETIRISVTPDGEQVSANFYYSSISADGQLIVFSTTSPNLVYDDTLNSTSDVFLHNQGLANTFEDTDKDGLLDIWEVQGITKTVGGVDVYLDLPAMGADPYRKDIFVEIDYMESPGICLPIVGCLFGHSHQPKPEAIAKIVKSFADAPVSNPDGSTGISLHVDAGSDSIMNSTTGETWGLLSQSNRLLHDNDLGSKTSNGAYDWSEFDSIKNKSFTLARASVFHYCIFAHNRGDSTKSGLSRDLGASDFIVSLGSFTNGVGTTNEQAGTFMHELGHNLGLRHGGDDHAAYEPNYLSVMNYAFQNPGLRINDQDGHFDYSRFALPDLNENNLDETVGLNGGAAVNNYGTRTFCSGGEEKIVGSVNGPIDWNCNSNNTNTNIQTDVNKDSNHTVLGSYNDWANLVFTGGAIGHDGVEPELPLETFDEEITPEEDALLSKDYKIAVASSGNTASLPGRTVVYTVTVANLGINADTYSVKVGSSLGWADVTHVPTSITLSAGESKEFQITVSVPTLVSSESIDNLSFSVVSQANPFVEDSAFSRTSVVSLVFIPLAIK